MDEVSNCSEKRVKDRTATGGGWREENENKFLAGAGIPACQRGTADQK